VNKPQAGVSIIGCGLIGHKRAAALSQARLVSCCDTEPSRAKALAERYKARPVNDYQEALADPEVDIVIVATTNDVVSKIALTAAQGGKYVLIEKPGARSAAELAALLPFRDRIRVGYNHRFHKAIRKAKEIWDSGSLGEPMMLRARYGHGGRVGYDKEWRANKELSGGGETLDQGSHLLDLSQYFLGNMKLLFGTSRTYFWDMPVDDNGFAVLENKDGKIAMLHASCTEWKNTFSLELYARMGKLDINGLGGSYGTERVTLYQMTPQMGPPDATTWEFPIDDSWAYEFQELLADMRLKRVPQPGVDEGLAVLRLVEGIYKGHQGKGK
jgi:predicted dehydrogenase